MKVSHPPFINHNLKWHSPGSKFWNGGVLPFKYVLPKIGNSADSLYNVNIGTSKDIKSGVGLLLTNIIRCDVKNA